MKQWELGYLAGMIDAECHIGIQRIIEKRRKTPAYVIRFELAMTDKRPIDFVNSLLPNAKVIHIQANGRRTDCYRLRVIQQEALSLMKIVYPYVQGKKRTIEICIEMDELRRKYTPDRQHFGTAHFQRLPKEFAEQADVLFLELRSLQLHKGRKLLPR